MDISTTTTITLTEAEIQEAVKQYIQTNALDLENKDVEFTTQLPAEMQVVVSEPTTVVNPNHHTKPVAQPVMEKDKIIDVLEDEPSIQNQDKSLEEHEVLSPCQPVKRPNPFAIDSVSQSTNTPIQTRNPFKEDPIVGFKKESRLMPPRAPKGIFG